MTLTGTLVGTWSSNAGAGTRLDPVTYATTPFLRTEPRRRKVGVLQSRVFSSVVRICVLSALATSDAVICIHLLRLEHS